MTAALAAGPTAEGWQTIVRLGEGFEKPLGARTLTRLYNERPAWLAQAHEVLDHAVAAAYGWADYTPQMPDVEIPRRRLATSLLQPRAVPSPKAIPSKNCRLGWVTRWPATSMHRSRPDSFACTSSGMRRSPREAA